MFPPWHRLRPATSGGPPAGAVRVAGRGRRAAGPGERCDADRHEDHATRRAGRAGLRHRPELNSPVCSAFPAALAPGATIADGDDSGNGDDRDLDQLTDREILSSHGHVEADGESDDGRRLIARNRNDTWGETRTRGRFTLDDAGRIARFGTGQA